MHLFLLFQKSGILALCFVLLGALCSSADVVINEIVASNRSGVEDESGQFDDWIELRNVSAETADIGGLYLTDSPANPTRWQIPAGTTLPGHSYLLIWADGHVEQGERHAAFSLRRSGGAVALVDRDGVTVLDQVDYPEQGVDISYGRPLAIEDDSFVFYPAPTAGQPNITTSVPMLATVEISKAGGFFRNSETVALATAFASGEIRYTLDGEQPTEDSILYENEITVTGSASITGAVFANGRRVGPVVNEVYLAVGEDLADFSSNLPVVVVESRGYRFSRDSSLNRDFPAQLVYSTFKEPDASGRARLEGATNYAGRAGMNVRGASSREWPKKSYKFETWDALDGNRDVSLLGLPVECDWILHGPYFDKTFMRNYLTYLWWERLGHFSVRTRFIELFINQDGDSAVEMEDYAGVYLLMEKIKTGPDRVDISDLQPFDNEGSAVTGGYVLQTTNIQQHFTSRRGVFMKYVSPRRDEITSGQRTWIRDYINDMESVLFNRDLAELADPIDGYRKWIDVPSHIDYDIMRELTRNIDGASTYMSIDRGGKLTMGPLWDYNQSIGMTSLFGGENGWKTDGWNNAYMRQAGHWAKWWDKLDADPDYQTLWNDRWVELRRSLLGTDILVADIDAAEQLLDEAQQRNYERWNVLGKSVWITGSPREAPGYKERDTYAKEVDWMRQWLVERIAWIDAQVPAPPEFQPAPGAVEVGAQVQISPGTDFKPIGGALHYTLDGSDPRMSGGAVYPNALTFVDPIPLTESVTVLARTRTEDGDWSALGSATYLVGARLPSGEDVVISEIHYNPLESQKLEFIEITNRSQSFLDLSGLAVSDAVQFTFAQLGIAAGASIVIVGNESAFRRHYGEDAVVAGEWTGRLANGGETLTLKSSDGRTFASFTYDDAAPWPREPDGNGPSLELLDLEGNRTDATAWRASAVTGGTPGVVGISYAVWAATLFPDNERNLATEDPDRDGANNFLEFAFGSDPLSPTSVPKWDAHFANGTLQITYRKRIGAPVRYQCEISTDLESWATPAADSAEISVSPAGSDGLSTLEDVTIRLADDRPYARISIRD